MGDARFPQFEQQVALLFEHSPLLAKALFARRPFASHAWLIDAAAQVLSESSEEEKVAIISSHPLIGANPASGMSAASKAEQSGGGADPATLERLAHLNSCYHAKFGFPFIVFVNGRSKQEIVPVFEERMDKPRQVELATATADFVSIARSRLTKHTA